MLEGHNRILYELFSFKDFNSGLMILRQNEEEFFCPPMVFENEKVFNSESLKMKKDSKKSQEI